MNTLRELWKFVADIWDTGNYWVRLGIFLLAAWPVIMAIAAFTPYPAFKAIVAMLPLLAIVFVFFAVVDPLIWGIVVAHPIGRRILKWIALIIGVELTMGAYYAAVPVHTDRGLIPLVLLFALAGFFLAISAPAGKIKRVVLSLIVASGIVLTFIFFLGGREKASARIEDLKKQPSQSTARVAEKSEVIIWSDPQQIKVVADRWSEKHPIPSGGFGIAVQKGEKAEVLFSNGKYYLLDNYKQVEFGNVSGSFQFRGINKDVVIYIYTAS